MNKINKTTGYFKSFDGTRIYYEVRGKGKPILLVYGIGCLINHWQHQIKYFSKHYQVISFDYRAHHLSDAPFDLDQLNIDSLAKDIKCLLDHLHIEQVSLWGHSFGAQVITKVSDIFPNSIANIVMINGFVTNPLKGMFGNDWTSSFFSLFKNGYKNLPETLSFVWKKLLNHPLAIRASALAGGFNLKLTSLKDIEIYARGMSAMNLNLFIPLFEEMMKFDGRSLLEKIKCPVLIVAGDKDSVTPLRFQQEMHQKILGSEILIVPYGSHCTQLDMPELVNLRIEKFLKENQYF